jgi:hypothetical protein
MQQLLGIGVLVMIVADGFVGVRLLMLARRTRALPELCFGLSFVALGVVGYPLSIVARNAATAGAPIPGLLPVALAFQDLASLTMFIATWQTFRPREAWPRAVAWLAFAAFAASLLGDAVAAGRWVLRDGGPWYELGFWTRAAAYGWAAVESGRYWLKMRRRLGLGLADPTVVDRFRLWMISSLAISCAFPIFYLGRLLSENVATSVPVLLATSVAGLVAGATVFLAFVPPAAYLARVRARACAS